jgi:hypothetical protein
VEFALIEVSGEERKEGCSTPGGVVSVAIREFRL